MIKKNQINIDIENIVYKNRYINMHDFYAEGGLIEVYRSLPLKQKSHIKNYLARSLGSNLSISKYHTRPFFIKRSWGNLAIEKPNKYSISSGIKI
jgi:hypothetical protein